MNQMARYFGPSFGDAEYEAEFKYFLKRLEVTTMRPSFATSSVLNSIINQGSGTVRQNEWSFITYTIGPFAFYPVFELPQADLNQLLAAATPARTTYVCPLWPDANDYLYYEFKVDNAKPVLVMPIVSPQNQLYLYIFQKPNQFDNARLEKMPITTLSQWLAQPHCYWHFEPLNLNRSYFSLSSYNEVIETQTEDSDMSLVLF